eukprot:351935-Chlamydomonas_euryale.AAC.1
MVVAILQHTKRLDEKLAVAVELQRKFKVPSSRWCEKLQYLSRGSIPPLGRKNHAAFIAGGGGAHAGCAYQARDGDVPQSPAPTCCAARQMVHGDSRDKKRSPHGFDNPCCNPRVFMDVGPYRTATLIRYVPRHTLWRFGSPYGVSA